MAMNMGSIILKSTERFPEKTAIIFGEKRYTYREFNSRINRVANKLTEMGAKKGDRIAMLSSNCPQFLETYFALAKLGAWAVPLNFRLVGRELVYALNDSSSTTLFLGEEFKEVVHEIRGDLETVEHFILIEGEIEGDLLDYEQLIQSSHDAEPDVPVDQDDIQMLCYTSGTTGFPKGAMLSHGNLIWNSINMNFGWGVTPDDVSICAAPLFHTGALHCVAFPTFHVGGTTIVFRNFDPTETIQAVERERVTSMLMLTSMWIMLAELPDLESYNVSSVRWCLCGGSVLPTNTAQKLGRVFKEGFIAAYGLTEASPGVSMLSPEFFEGRPDSIGKPFPHVDVRLVDDQDQDVAVGETGEIIVRGPNVFKGYYNRPEVNAETLRNGWLHTGDLAKYDDQGFMYFVDRKKDMIKTGGENVYAAEVEYALTSHPKVVEAAVIGVPDPKWVETIKAYVVLKPGEKVTADELIEHCKNIMASYKKPRFIEFIDELPKNPSGKVVKPVLRDLSNVGSHPASKI
jgi:acyl-CoA synthetase (AMP-forming)/AMP-acid ligase II